ncbi:MAG: hypothetical protein ABIK83_01475 [Candidatus Zixiibacteriota bacterium]
MSNYQILEIVLDGLFFATVAAIAVIFAVIRERSVREAQSEQVPNRSIAFPKIMNDVVTCMPTSADLIENTGMGARVINRLTGPSVGHNSKDTRLAVSLTRAEREFMSSITEEGSRQTA